MAKERDRLVTEEKALLESRKKEEEEAAAAMARARDNDERAREHQAAAEQEKLQEVKFVMTRCLQRLFACICPCGGDGFPLVGYALRDNPPSLPKLPSSPLPLVEGREEVFTRAGGGSKGGQEIEGGNRPYA